MPLDMVIKQIISLFIIVIVGFYAGNKNIIDESFSKGLTRLLLDISIPLLIISSFSFDYSTGIGNNIAKAFMYSLVIFIITPFFIKPLLVKIEKRKRNVLQFAMVFSNCGFMGFPVVESVFGHEGVIYTAIFNMIFNIFVWTYGIMLFNNRTSMKDIKKVINNPGIISSIIGLVLMIFSIKIPSVLLEPMKMVGGLTTPIAMLIVGSVLSRTDLKELIKDKSMYYGSFIKLILIPFVLFLISNLFNENSLVIKTFILMQAMPAATTTSLFAENFNSNKEYSACIVSFSTLLSLFTIPLIIKYFL